MQGHFYTTAGNFLAHTDNLYSGVSLSAAEGRGPLTYQGLSPLAQRNSTVTLCHRNLAIDRTEFGPERHVHSLELRISSQGQRGLK